MKWDFEVDSINQIENDPPKSKVRLASEAVEQAFGGRVIDLGPSSLGIGISFTDEERKEILSKLDSSLVKVGLRLTQNDTESS